METAQVGEAEGDEVSWMETAPWRANKRARSRQSEPGTRPTMTESFRIPPTRPPRPELAAIAEQRDPMDEAVADDTELEEQGEEDVPANPGREECHAIWASLLDVQDEDQVRDNLERASGSNSRPDMQLAPRHVERVRRIIHGMTTEGIIRMSLNLPQVLHGIQMAINDIIQEALDIRKQKQVKARHNELAKAQGEDFEEEVQVDDEECEEAPAEEEGEDNTLMQNHRSMTRKAEGSEACAGTTAMPLQEDDKSRLIQAIKDTLEKQTNAELALALLALLGEEPDSTEQANCSAEEEESGSETLTTLPEL